MTQFDRLRQSFALTVGDILLPGVSGFTLGGVATVLTSQDEAREYISANRKNIEGLKLGKPGLVAVDDPWKFMRRAAGEGLAGIQSADLDFPDTFMFMVRVEEAGSNLPTVLATCNEGKIGICLTRSVVKQLSHAELLHWQRFDILDRVTARWGVKCPFREWNHGDPLYELTADGRIVTIAEVPLMGDWNSPEGAFAFFTSEKAALDYREHRMGFGHERIITVGGSVPDESVDMIASLMPTRVDNLEARLKELEDIWGFAAWCINPSGHRENSGFGRFWEYREDQVFQLHTVAGNWKVRSGNQFEKMAGSLAWSGNDTLFWSGSQSVQLLPLDVSFGIDPIRESETSTDMSDSETEEWLEQFLFEEPLSKILNFTEREPSLGSFFISCWDSVTGFRYDSVPEFCGFLEALRFLLAYEREYDKRFRLEGAASCTAIGFVGSGDEKHEKLRGERFRRGLVNLGKRHILQGYHPSYASNLVALANATLGTLHVDFAGYAKDLLWSSQTESVDSLLEDLNIDSETWMVWKEGVETVIDTRGKELVVERIGKVAWNNLNPKVQHFLSTALRHLETQGHAPQLDYAPISLEIVKGLEVELGNLLEGFRESLTEPKLDAFENERSFTAFLYEGKKAPTLGVISYLLRKPDADSSPIKRAFHEFLNSKANGEFLTSKRFTNRDLQKVINHYRNGGAHDSPISEEVCRSCLEKLVGTQEKPGLIPKVIEWKKSK